VSKGADPAWPAGFDSDAGEVAWQWLCHASPLVRTLEREARARLLTLSLRFLRSKTLTGAGGLELTDRMRLIVAAQACLPILELELSWYDGWHEVVVYPGAFVARHEYADEAGVVHDVVRPLVGEAWHNGPVVISWDDAEDAARGQLWGNPVIHEFAHKLDLLNGVANGMPPLHAEMDRRAWTRVFQRAFKDLRRRVDNDLPTALDDYGAEDPGEFFAVASEAFFAEPLDLADAYPHVYQQLRTLYRQNPIGDWDEAASG
jgi:Mlc titration factor MtfA (ptsG expression regulator)